MRILCLGMSHKTMPLEIRERLTLGAEQIPAALADLRTKFPQAEFAILSTCNRMEVYAARRVHGHPRFEELSSWLASHCSTPSELLHQRCYELADANVARHLFAVVGGLDSMVLGEAQIVAQAKAAYQTAREANCAGPVLNELFQTSLHVAKEIRTQTGISQGPTSLASLAVDAAMTKLGSLKGKCMLNIGAGKMNELMLRQLCQMGPAQVMIANRSPQRARALADRCGGKFWPMSRLDDALVTADVVLTCTSATQPVITTAALANAQQKRSHAPMLVIDLAVPRDVEPSAASITGLQLINIDALGHLAQVNTKARQRELVKAEAIIASHLSRVLKRLNIHHVAPTIDDLYRRMRDIAEQELAAAANKLAKHDDAKADMLILQRAMHRAIRRIMHPAARTLRSHAGSDSARVDIAAIRKIFELDNPLHS